MTWRITHLSFMSSNNVPGLRHILEVHFIKCSIKKAEIIWTISLNVNFFSFLFMIKYNFFNSPSAFFKYLSLESPYQFRKQKICCFCFVSLSFNSSDVWVLCFCFCVFWNNMKDSLRSYDYELLLRHEGSYVSLFIIFEACDIRCQL